MAPSEMYPARQGSPHTTLAAPYQTGESTMELVDASMLDDGPNLVCLSGPDAGEFRYGAKEGNTLTSVEALAGTPTATWPPGTYVFRGISAYDHNAFVENIEELGADIEELRAGGIGTGTGAGAATQPAWGFPIGIPHRAGGGMKVTLVGDYAPAVRPDAVQHSAYTMAAGSGQKVKIVTDIIRIRNGSGMSISDTNVQD